MTTELNDNLSTLRLPELQARFQQATGKTTKSPNKTFLIRAIEKARTGDANADTPKPRRKTPAPKRAAKRTKATRTRATSAEWMVLPVRLPTSVVQRVDAAWKRQGLKSRMECFRRALEGFFRDAGEPGVADLFKAETAE